jgi:hypothetical protein
MNRVSAKLTVLILFIFGIAAATADPAPQDTSQGSTQQQSETGNSAPPTSDVVLDENSGADAESGEEDEEESPDRFIPTEEISQDLGVSFPVDI